eukprot:TRINITY_DN3556_c0_g1_i1.p1 TRINITY_DN3556_c0_g1~~TRINITY_DN3556_c0_g1_i1.p1  ORF type:complete len:270 (-),score=50.81 TRINITY_DN3556_c0_g1_i1:175-984(-)
MDTVSRRRSSDDERSEDQDEIHEETLEDSLDALKKTTDDKEIKAIRVVRKRAKLTHEHLTSKDGLPRILKSCQKLSFKGVGHEKEDIKLLVRTYEEWGMQLFPRLAFTDLINQVRNMGRHRNVKEWVEWVKNGNDPESIPSISFLGQDEEFPEPDQFSNPESPHAENDDTDADYSKSLKQQTTHNIGNDSRMSSSIPTSTRSTAVDSLHTNANVNANTNATETLNSFESMPSPPIVSLAPSLTTEQMARMERNRLEAIKRFQEKRKAAS